MTNVHQVRNTLKYVVSKDMKDFANYLKTIYHAPNAELGYEQLLEVKAKWNDNYPNAMKRWFQPLRNELTPKS